MKIMHLISGGDVGGAKTHVLSLLQGLGRTETVRLVCFLEGPFAQEAREMGIDTLVITQGNLFAVVRTLAEMIRTEGFEIVHCHGSRANLLGTMLQRKVDVPMVTTVHSDYRLDYLGRPFHRLTYGTINTVCVRRIPYHIGVSDAMADLLISRGFDPQTMFTIYNGVDFTPVTPRMTRAEYFESIGLSAGAEDVVFGIAARLSAVKDVATLVRAFGLACQSVENIRLVIAGDGEQRAMLEALAKECCPEGKYVFAGWVEDTDSFYHAIDVNTLTSLSETFPYALTEGARMHCATIASRVGGVPYLIQDGVYGLLFEAQNHAQLAAHMVLLAKDSALRARLGEALYHRASTHFSVDATVNRQREIYEILLRRARRNPGKRDGVLICGAYGKGNAGDDSILEAILQQMRHIDPDLPIYVLSRNPKETRLRYRVGAIHTFDFWGFFHRMGKTKLYVNGGGSLIQDVTSTRSLQYYLSNIALAKKRGNQVLMYGCGIGPVSSPANRRAAGRTINQYVDAITLREPGSARELQEMGVTRPKISITADPALLLDPAPPEAVEAFLRTQGIDPDEKHVLFVLRPWQGMEEKLPVFAAAARWCYEKKGMVPVFFALEPKRDRAVAEQVAAMVDCPHHIVSAPHDGHLIVGMMGAMEAVVSMRLHALIFAAGQGVPLVGVVYDPKVSGFLDYLHQTRYLPLEEVSQARLMPMLAEALAQTGRDDASAMRALAEENEQAARRLLEEFR